MFNEEAGAERCVVEVCRELGRLPHRSRLFVVDDGSSDGTAAILHRIGPAQPLLQVVTHPANRGYGAALRTGVEAAHDGRFDYVLFMDSDLTNAPADVPRFVAEMSRGADVVKATRYSGGGGVSGVPFSRWVISAVGNRIARVLFGLPIHDCTNGFRAVKVSLLKQMELRERRFPVIMEEPVGATTGESCINEDGLPSAAIRFAADHGVIRNGAPKRGRAARWNRTTLASTCTAGRAASSSRTEGD